MCAATEPPKTEQKPAPAENGPKKENEPNNVQGGNGGGNRGGGNRRPYPFGNNRGGGGNRGNRQFQNRNFQFQPKVEKQENADGDNQKAPAQGGGNHFNQNRRNQNNFNRDERHQRGADDRFAEKIAAISGPTVELPPIDTKEKKFAGRCRLYIGNLTNDTTKEDLEQLFAPYGETSEFFMNTEKNFAFIRLDYRANAEKARRELDGFLRKGRQLRVRFAPHSSAVKVKNLNPFVTNELLEWAFQVFGEIERAVVIANERGQSTGEGIVEFARKPGAVQALKRCSEGCYFLTGSLRPVIVEPFELVDDTDGFNEKSIFKKSPEFYKEREVGPRFPKPSSFEADYGNRWKNLWESFKQKEEALKRELKLEEEKLEAQMEYARYEHETELLREQLRQREQDKERQKREWELKERQAEENRRLETDLVRRQSEEAAARLLRQDEERRRRQQENDLLAHAQQLTNILEQQEQSLAPFNRREQRGPIGIQGEPKSLMEQFNVRNIRGGRDDQQRLGRWAPQDRRGPQPLPLDDFPNKRRRY